MADAGLFIGWGAPVRGREAKSIEVFGEALAFYGGLESDGRIESHDVALLSPHGGDLDGFILLRGSAEQMAALRQDEEFQRMTTRAQMIVDNVGVVDAALGSGIESQMAHYQAAIGDLG